jgi:hypothetical protein
VGVSWEKVCVADLEWAIKVGGFTLRLWMRSSSSGGDRTSSRYE